MDLTSGDGKKLGINTSNSNNLLSDQDVNISLTLGQNDRKQTDSKVFDDEKVEREPDPHQKEVERQEWLDNLQKEKEQWDALENLQHSSTGSMKVTSLISFSEALQYFQTRNLSSADIKPTVSRSGFSAFVRFLFGPPRLNPALIEERNLIFCIAQTQLDDLEEIHLRVLQTIYKKLTGSKFDCPRRGSHWETIGFQGNDPSTDLRGTGFLSLLHLLHGITDPKISGVFTEIYRLSLDEVQNFPFCVMSINVTRIALHVLREEKLTRDCNKRKQVIAVLNDFFIAVFLHIYTIWKNQYKTMKDSGHVMQEAEKQASKNPKLLLRNLETTLKERQAMLKKQACPVLPVAIAGPLNLDETTNQRRASAASSVSSASEPKNMSQHSLDIGTPNSARFVPVKKTSVENLPDFTDICEVAKEEKLTDL